MLTDNDKANRWIEKIAEISGKVADASKSNVVQTAIATIVSDNGDSYTVRLLSSPEDGSQDFDVYSKTSETLRAGDNVFLYYIGDFTNAYIEMLVDGGNMPHDTGVTDYADLTSKPQINGVTLIGNKTTSDLGITLSTQYTPKGTVSQPTFTGTAASVTMSGTPEGTVSKPTFTGAQGNISVSGTPNGTVAISIGTGTANYTPEGTVSKPTFTGMQGNVSVSGTPTGSVSISTASSGTTNYTPAGTVSQPTTTVTVNTTTVNSITDVGTLPAWTASVANEILTIGWSQGSLPTKGSNTTVATGIKSATTTQPTFTGTGARLEASFSGNSLSSTGTFTPAGSVSQPTFTGTGKELKADFTGAATTSTGTFTPAGSVSQPTFTGTAMTSTGTITPTGTVSQPTFTGTEETITVS